MGSNGAGASLFSTTLRSPIHRLFPLPNTDAFVATSHHPKPRRLCITRWLSGLSYTCIVLIGATPTPPKHGTQRGLTTRIHRSFFSLSPSLLYHTPPVLCCLVPSDFQWCSSPTFSPNSCQLSTPTLLACRRTSAILCANRRRKKKQVRVSASEPTAA